MKLKILGTCSGLEPYPGRFHTSFLLIADDKTYWFDAGGDCSRNASLSGVDLLSTRAVFLSHTHMDHIGGLPALLWDIRKLCTVRRTEPFYPIDVYLPDLRAWDGIMTLLSCTEGGYQHDFPLDAHRVSDGLVFRDENVTVRAFHNFHLPEREDGFLSFSFRAETAETSFVFSGDLRKIEELDPVIGDGCDLLLCETGHHTVADVGEYIKVKNRSVGQVLFLHHGRSVLADMDTASEETKRFPCPARLLSEGDEILL